MNCVHAWRGFQKSGVRFCKKLGLKAEPHIPGLERRLSCFPSQCCRSPTSLRAWLPPRIVGNVVHRGQAATDGASRPFPASSPPPAGHHPLLPEADGVKGEPCLWAGRSPTGNQRAIYNGAWRRGRPERRWGVPGGCRRIFRNPRPLLGQDLCSLSCEGTGSTRKSWEAQRLFLACEDTVDPGTWPLGLSVVGTLKPGF